MFALTGSRGSYVQDAEGFAGPVPGFFEKEPECHLEQEVTQPVKTGTTEPGEFK